MNVSLASNTAVPMQSVQNLNKSPERVEGNTPDGDGDKDDVIKASASAQSANTTISSGSLGSNINVIA